MQNGWYEISSFTNCWTLETYSYVLWQWRNTEPHPFTTLQLLFLLRNWVLLNITWPTHYNVLEMFFWSGVILCHDSFSKNRLCCEAQQTPPRFCDVASSRNWPKMFSRNLANKETNRKKQRIRLKQYFQKNVG